MDAGFGLFDVVGGEVDFFAVFVDEGRSGFEFEGFGDCFVEVDLCLDTVRCHVGLELIDVPLAAGDGGEIADEVVGALVAGGVEPFGLVGEDEVAVFFPVALKTGSFDSGSGSDGVRVDAGERIAAVDDSELAVIFLDELFDPRLEEGASGTLVVGVFVEDDLGGLEIAFDVVGDLTVVVVGVNEFCGVVFGEVDFRGNTRVVSAGLFRDLRDDDDGADEEGDDNDKRD